MYAHTHKLFCGHTPSSLRLADGPVKPFEIDAAVYFSLRFLSHTKRFKAVEADNVTYLHQL